jgi:hypothetical protein
MALRSLAVWFGLLVVAMLNGAFREAALVPRLGTESAHAVSSVTLSLAILIVTYLAIPWIRPTTVRGAWVVGIGWLLLTVTFEFGFGHYLRGRPWEELLVDYNVARGRIWTLVLVTTAVAPIGAARLRGLLPTQAR